MVEQNYSNHARYDPTYHFFISPIVSINVLVAIWFIIRHPSYLTVWNLIFAVAIAALAFTARVYALKNQNRIIRLEERVRMMQVLPPDLSARIPELKTRDLIALRFCSDDQLPDLTRSVLAGECSGKEIKKRIHTWRPDYLRV
jgi:Family of unknown function (DUF6526)